MKSELCIFYIHNGTLGGALSDILHDSEVIKKEAGTVGLDLNPQKSEVIGINSDLITTVQSALSGSPIGDSDSITVAEVPS